MGSLQQKLLQSGILDDISVDELLKVWCRTKQLKPKEILIHFNQRESALYFVSTGCLRLFVIDNNAEETNIGFGYQNTFITSFQSFITGKPSLIGIEAVLSTEVLMISKESIDHVIATNPAIAKWYQTIIENTLAGHIQRQIELITLGPKERYEAFQQRSSHLINSIPLKHIASYLMMTPETLSRVRASIS